MAVMCKSNHVLGAHSSHQAGGCRWLCCGLDNHFRKAQIWSKVETSRHVLAKETHRPSNEVYDSPHLSLDMPVCQGERREVRQAAYDIVQ